MDKNGTQNKYAYLDQLSTEMLETILRADVESPESGDDGMILYITEVLVQREKENPTGRLCDVDEAWKEFQEYYNIPEGDGLSLYPMIEPEDESPIPPNGDDLLSAAKNSQVVHGKVAGSIPSRSTKRSAGRHFFKRALLVVATITILMFGMITAQAAGLDVFGALAQWTDDTFRFVSPQDRALTPAPTPSTEPTSANSQELHDAFQTALDQCGITEPLAPTWFPEGCEMDGEADIMSSELTDKIVCGYNLPNENFFIITVQNYRGEFFPGLTETEIDGQFVEQYISTNNMLFYIMTNNDSLSGTWSNGETVSMKIYGKIPIDTIKQFINSIGA